MCDSTSLALRIDDEVSQRSCTPHCVIRTGGQLLHDALLHFALLCPRKPFAQHKRSNVGHHDFWGEGPPLQAPLVCGTRRLAEHLRCGHHSTFCARRVLVHRGCDAAQDADARRVDVQREEDARRQPQHLSYGGRGDAGGRGGEAGEKGGTR